MSFLLLPSPAPLRKQNLRWILGIWGHELVNGENNCAKIAAQFAIFFLYTYPSASKQTSSIARSKCAIKFTSSRFKQFVLLQKSLNCSIYSPAQFLYFHLFPNWSRNKMTLPKYCFRVPKICYIFVVLITTLSRQRLNKRYTKLGKISK